MFALVFGIMGLVCQAYATDKGNVWANLDVQMYGYLKLDASYDDSRTTPGNYVLMVNPETGDSLGVPKNDDEFNMTANQTRLGLKITGPASENVKTSGQVEFDFYGGNTSSSINVEPRGENKAKLMLRHAFMTFEKPEDKLSLLAGQTWDVVAPLNPGTLMYTVMWWTGNIGYRRPQIRLTKDIDIDGDKSIKLQAAVARTIGTGTAIAYEPGADSGYPSLQGRVALTLPAIGPKPAVVGLSGHWGREEHDYITAGVWDSADADTWSGCVDATLPVSEKLTLQGEIHTGANLSAYLGGIGQGVNGTGTSSVQEISTGGGWVAASIGPYDSMRYNVGYGYSECSSADLIAGQRETNSSIFANAIHQINDHASVGVELSRWETEYVGSNYADGTAMRGQVSFIYKN